MTIDVLEQLLTDQISWLECSFQSMHAFVRKREIGKKCESVVSCLRVTLACCDERESYASKIFYADPLNL